MSNESSRIALNPKPDLAARVHRVRRAH